MKMKIKRSARALISGLSPLGGKCYYTVLWDTKLFSSRGRMEAQESRIPIDSHLCIGVDILH